MKIVQQWGLVALVGLSACQTQAPVETNPQTGIKYQPELALQDLFHDVQMSGIFPDSKTMVDCKPMSAPRIYWLNIIS